MGIREREEQRKRAESAKTGMVVVKSIISQTVKPKNEVFLENGIRHEFTGDEILVLQILLEGAELLFKDKERVTYFDDHREQQILSAVASLKSLFVDHLD